MASSGLDLTVQQQRELAHAVNQIASFLACEDIVDGTALNNSLDDASSLSFFPGPQLSPHHKVVVLCPSSVLSTVEAVLAWAKNRQELASKKRLDANDHSSHGRNDGSRDDIQRFETVVLVLCGGIGHSTDLIYEAVKNHPVFHDVADEVHGQPEARVLRVIAERFYGLHIGQNNNDLAKGHNESLLILVEDQSTNCGANATQTRIVLESNGIVSPESIVVAQDPTMSRRTVASFQKTYMDLSEMAPRILGWPTFVPKVWLAQETGSQAGVRSPLSFLTYESGDGGRTHHEGLWDMDRFIDLVMGEIPRLRDDVNGYGPRGKGFIAHVGIPTSVETAWGVVRGYLEGASREVTR